ncbi:hypothetical protein niasHS_014222 [Heterodera schachtii]|uniref:Peptidase M41 domain-containing protein n=1 Tax=Heterodera schachtii TaxID=97005 RepID=A0ABD2I9Z1_HETSC
MFYSFLDEVIYGYGMMKIRWIKSALVAAHEAAHSLVILLNEDIAESFISTTIIGQNGLDGLTLSTRRPNEDCTPAQLRAALMATMAGKAVEIKLVGVSTGHADDLADARAAAREV